MARIDRLGWAAGMSFVAYGLRVGIRVSEVVALDLLAPVLPPHTKPSRPRFVDRLYSFIQGGPGARPNLRRLHALYSGSTRIARAADPEVALDALRSDIRLYLAERARQRVFVHAGVVGWQGRAIVIPGQSHAGKSELVAALVKAGATYLSDECAVFDARGRVHPYAAPISLRRGVRAYASRPPISACRDAATALPVAAVALVKYRPGGRWRPRTLPPGQAVLALLAHSFPVRRKPAATLAALERVVQSAVVLKGLRGEADVAARALVRTLEGRSPTRCVA